MKKILLFGAGKSATVLIDYLIAEAEANEWFIIIADANKEQIISKTNNSPCTEAVQMNITDKELRVKLIQQATLVISMMPPALHFLIARDCVEFGKNLLTASYLDANIKSLQSEILQKKLLFICEMGLDPGIDHMSAMKIMDEIKEKGGNVTSFKSHCGGLVSPASDDNPWHYKISWNPRNVVLAGKSGAVYKLNNKIQQLNYKELFSNCSRVDIDGAGSLAFYPNRDSLNYLPIYQLEQTATFVRTTLRAPAFCDGWNAIVQADLANDETVLNPDGITFEKWSAPIVPFVNEQNKNLLAYLGLFDNVLVPSSANTSADILQYLLETRLLMQPNDKDRIVMMHEIEYVQSGNIFKLESSLIVEGEDHLRTAMAKTVGLPLGITVKLILNGTLQLIGIYIPTIKEIYNPVLSNLEKAGICFVEKNV